MTIPVSTLSVFPMRTWIMCRSVRGIRKGRNPEVVSMWPAWSVLWVTWDIRMTIVSCWMLLFEATVRLFTVRTTAGVLSGRSVSDIISITKNSWKTGAWSTCWRSGDLSGQPVGKTLVLTRPWPCIPITIAGSIPFLTAAIWEPLWRLSEIKTWNGRR